MSKSVAHIEIDEQMINVMKTSKMKQHLNNAMLRNGNFRFDCSGFITEYIQNVFRCIQINENALNESS